MKTIFQKISFLFIGAVFLLSISCEEDVLAPKIDSIEPVFGPFETLVTIEGSALAGIEEISFSGQPINFNNAYNADHALLFRIPKDVPLGEHEVILQTAGGSVSTQFTVTFEAPEIFEIFPESAAPGESVTIRGKNFYEPLEVYFFDSIQANILQISTDSLVVEVPQGIEKGFVQVIANGGRALSPVRFFTSNSILVNDFDGNGLRSETSKWIFQGSVEQNSSNAVQNSDPEAISGNFLKLSGKDELDIQWIGGAQSNFGFPGDSFETFGIEAAANNVSLEMDIHNNGREETYVLLILTEKDGSPNDFTHKLKVDGNGWERVSIPLIRFTDLNDVIISPEKVKLLKIHLYDEEASGNQLEVNVDNINFVQSL